MRVSKQGVCLRWQVEADSGSFYYLGQLSLISKNEPVLPLPAHILAFPPNLLPQFGMGSVGQSHTAPPTHIPPHSNHWALPWCVEWSGPLPATCNPQSAKKGHLVTLF